MSDAAALEAIFGYRVEPASAAVAAAARAARARFAAFARIDLLAALRLPPAVRAALQRATSAVPRAPTRLARCAACARLVAQHRADAACDAHRVRRATARVCARCVTHCDIRQ